MTLGLMAARVGTLEAGAEADRGRMLQESLLKGVLGCIGTVDSAYNKA